jgi:proteasome lid subunit RPN8/RPN11
MKRIERIYLSHGDLEETIKVLRHYGEYGCEGLVLWLGRFRDERSCDLEKVLVPPQEAITGEDGVGYFVTGETLFKINKLLATSGLRLIAQVHSHPGRAYHSAADNRYCIVTEEGGFSIVVPDFGFGASTLPGWAIYRLTNGLWRDMLAKAARAIFVIDGNSETDSGGAGMFSRLSKFLKGDSHD